MTARSSSSGAEPESRPEGGAGGPVVAAAEIEVPTPTPTRPRTRAEASGSFESLLPSTDRIADGVGTRSSYAVSLDMFEGPLDLLLHLVRRHELDILDIPIKFIASKYIEYISFAQALDIEIAGEYLVMAATLAFLKSRELLPPSPEDEDAADDEEEGVDPREELIRRLIEYERFRNAGDDLDQRPQSGRDVFARGGALSIEAPDPGLAPVTLFKLAEAYNRILDRAKISEEHEVVIEPVTVRQRMHQLSVLLAQRRQFSFESLFLERTWSSERELRSMLVVTLMSILEMVKLGLVGIHQAAGSETVELERLAEADAMASAVSVYREDGEEDDDANDDADADADPEAEAKVDVEADAKDDPEAGGGPAAQTRAAGEPGEEVPAADPSDGPLVESDAAEPQAPSAAQTD